MGDCAAERLDTFTGIFTKDLGGSSARTATAHIALTDAQMSAIYRAIEDIHFFDDFMIVEGQGAQWRGGVLSEGELAAGEKRRNK